MILKTVLLLICLLGASMTVFGIYFIGLGYAARDWPMVEGQVISTSVRVDTSMSDEGDRSQREAARRYYPEISYRWTLGGQSYTGSRYRLGTTYAKFKTKTEAQSAAAAYPPDSAITVHYDPEHPDQAVLDPAPSAGIYVPLPLGLLILAMGLLGLRFSDRLMAAMRE